MPKNQARPQAPAGPGGQPQPQSRAQDSGRHFVSQIGQTATATVATYLEYVGAYPEPLSITLLATARNERLLPGIAAKLGRVSPGVPLKVVDIAADHLGGGRPTVEDVYPRLEDELGRLAINMMGGPKTAGQRGLFALRKRDHLFVQLTEEKFLASRFQDGTVRTQSRPVTARLPVEEVLDLQMIERGPASNPPWDLGRLCRQAGVSPPRDALYNVVLGGRRVDCLWVAENNILNLLFVMDESRAQTPARRHKADLERARALEVLAEDKGLLNGLFNRKIVALVTTSRMHERYELESAGKIESHKVAWRGDRLTPEAAEALALVFRPWRPEGPAAAKPAWRPLRKPTLVTAQGRLSDATLLAVAGHNLPQLVLLYTPGDPWVAHAAERTRQRAAQLGLEDVFLLETDQSGANLHAHLPEELGRWAGEGLRVEVNLSPGTKPQSTALGLWAISHDIPAWAIEGEGLIRLGPDSRPAAGPGPADVVRERPLAGLSLKNRLDFMIDGLAVDYGWGSHSEGWRDPFYNHFLHFLALLAKQEDRSALRLLTDEIAAGGYSFLPEKGAEQIWRFSWPGDAGGGHYLISRLEGYWYERVVCKAMSALGNLGPVRYEAACGVEVRLPRGERNQLTERDVLVATSRGRLFMVSCKTSHKTGHDINKRASYDVFNETKAVAKTLGRFVIPVICTLTEAEPAFYDGVLVIGWPALGKPKQLAELLDKCAETNFD
ncbi:MAG: hypothetical protein LBP95_14015 [Deltaproteobacteria bacterium]|nr:hypothetical protein [Deltaproteobacteria bacterium]